MKVHHVNLGLLAILFICLYSNVNVGQAEVVWSDDFNDGNFDGWTIELGEWTVTNETLQGQDPDPERPYCALFKPSTVAYGTWSLDIRLQRFKDLYVSFIDNNSTFGEFGYYYELKIEPHSDFTYFILYKNEGSHFDSYEALYSHVVYEVLDGAWHHVDITRELNGKFSVYLDSELLFEIVDTNIVTSEEFWILSQQYGALIDNIVIKNVVEVPFIKEWQDDFNDGDYDGWGISRGNWSAEKNYLRVSDKGGIYHLSAVSNGTWSFDVYVTPTPAIDHSILFMLDAPFTGPIMSYSEFTSYFISIYAFPDGRSSTIDLRACFGSWHDTYELLEEYMVGWDLSHRWHHIDITRDEGGRICVYLNRELVIDFVDTRINSSSYFQFSSLAGPALDNIVVKDVIDPPQIQEWSEDFNDRDLEGWLDRGNWSASTQAAQAFDDPEIVEDPDKYFYSRLKRPSNIAYGTWSFDLLLKDSKNILFSFMNFRDDQDRWNDYYFEIKPIQHSSGFFLGKNIKQEYTLITQYYILKDLTDKWIHLDITRDIQGRFKVFLDGEVILGVQDNELKYSEYFGIYSEVNGPIIDNIHVRNVVDIFSPIALDITVELSEESVIQGEDVLVSLQTEDHYGVLITDASVELALDGQMVSVPEVSWGVYQATVDTSELLGTIELIITAEKTGFISSESAHHFEVVAPASFAVSGLTLQPSVVERGKQAAVTVEVENVGGLEGSHQLLVDIEGVVREEITVTLDPGASKTVFYEFFAAQAGTFTVNIGGLTDILTVLEPASFEVSNLSIEPDSVKEGEPVSITVECSNTGGVSGSYDVVLKIDGETEDTTSVTVDAGESTTVTFQVLTSESGTYLVEVHGLTGSIEVRRAKTGIPGFPIESIIAGLTIVLLAKWLYHRRS